MGRTALPPDKRRSYTVQVTVTPAVAAWLRTVAERNCESVSAYANRLFVREMGE